MNAPPSSFGLNPAAERRKRLAQLLREKARHTKTKLGTSIAQQGVWYMQQKDSDTSAYNVSFCVRVVSGINIACAKEALQQLVDRHAMLRATFHHSGDDLRMEVSGASEAGFTEIDVSGVSDDKLQTRAEAALNAPFDLVRGPLIRMTIFARTPSDHVLLLVVHHLVCDGWSLGVLLQEFMEVYEAESLGRSCNLPARGPDFDQFIVRQKNWLASPAAEVSRSYWLRQLSGELPELSLPTYQSRQADLPLSPAVHNFTGENNLYLRLQKTAQSCGVTFFCLLLAAYQVFLTRICGQDDIIIGVPMAGRSEPECEGVVGHFVNLVAMRSKIQGNPTFRQFAQQTWIDLKNAIEHQEFPFVELVRQLRPRGRVDQKPIFRTHLNVLKPAADNPINCLLAPQSNPIPWGSLRVVGFPIESIEENYDLAVRIIEGSEDFQVKIQYDRSLFTHQSAEYLGSVLKELLQSIALSPDLGVRQLNLLTPAGRFEMLETWNATERLFGGARTVADLFEAQVDQCANAVAIRFGEDTLSYAQLDRRSNQLATQLAAEGIGPGDLVGVCTGRCVELAIALLGIMKAGAAYVPIDPRYPRDRLDFVLNDCAPRLILTTPVTDMALSASISIPRLTLDNRTTGLDELPDRRPLRRVGPEDRAYVIYTSGSTGQPKGVQIPNKALVNFLLGMREQLPIAADDVLLSVTTPAFDIFGLELLLPLSVGACVDLASEDETKDGQRLAARLTRNKVSFMQATPATWRMLLASGFSAKGKFVALCGGEALEIKLARSLLAANAELWNMYGPTETTIWSCTERVIDVADATISIGRPIANTQTYVLDDLLQPVPIGVVGTLYIGGYGLALGYLNRDEMTKDKFLPFSLGTRSGRLYNTGDLARHFFDGRLECLGREDQQIKLRGYRIELGEIEYALAEHPDVEQAVAILNTTQTDNPQLTAFVRFRPGANDADARDFRAWLRKFLPDYMIPTDIVSVESFPQTPNGKVDRKSLSGASGTRVAAKAARKNASIDDVLPNEQFLLDIWRNLLGTDRISIDDDFFDIGGHSLLAARMFAQLESFHHRALPVALIAKAPTIRLLAKSIDELPALNPGPCLFTFRDGDDSPPLILMPSLAGTALHWRSFVNAFSSNRPFVGVYIAGEPNYAVETDLEALAMQCAKLIAEAYPDRQCHLLGYSFGGTLAFEVARQLHSLGCAVGVTAILDRAPTTLDRTRPRVWPIAKNLASRFFSALTNGRIDKKIMTLLWIFRLARKRSSGRGALMQEYILGDSRDISDRSRRLVNWFTALESRYEPRPHQGNLLVIRASKRPLSGPFEHDLGWTNYVDGKVDVEVLDGGHSQMLERSQVLKITEVLSRQFSNVEMLDKTPA